MDVTSTRKTTRIPKPNLFYDDDDGLGAADSQQSKVISTFVSRCVSANLFELPQPSKKAKAAISAHNSSVSSTLAPVPTACESSVSSMHSFPEKLILSPFPPL